MERTYKAFISYRHLPLDMKIARKLHRRIEHFVIPKKLRRDGSRHPGIVFRDQDELPTSGDLSMDIQNALERSEYLIVICTPETPKSKWVLQEIRYFLKHHDRDHVLAVLADGTPQESFPPILTAVRRQGKEYGPVNDRTITEEGEPSDTPFFISSSVMPEGVRREGARSEGVCSEGVCSEGVCSEEGRSEEVRSEEGLSEKSQSDKSIPEDSLSETIEPLAANIAADSEYRRNRLFQTESLRILAALIGCSYDELYHREQRYRARRLAAAAGTVMAVAAVIIGILLNRNAVIQANLEQSLRNQSVYLAEESLNLLQNGDRLSAIALALEALPSKEQDRPLVSRAEYALGCALGAYTSEGNARGLTGSGALSHSTDIRDFRQNRNGDILCTVTSENTAVCWDPVSMQKKWEKKLGKSFGSSWGETIGFLRDQDPLIRTDARLFLIDGDTGETVWSKTVGETEENDDTFTSFYQAGYSQDTGELTVFTGKYIYRLDAENGDRISSFLWPAYEIDGEKLSYTPSSARLSEDGTMAAVSFTYGEYPDSRQGIAVIDLHGKTIRSCIGGMPYSDFYIPDACAFPDSDHFIFITCDLSGGSSSTFSNSMHLQTYSTAVLNCLDLNTGKIIWTSEHRSSFAGGNHNLLLDKTVPDRPVLAYAQANHLDILDPSDGTILGETEFYSRIISLDAFNGRIVCVTEDGQEGFLDPSDPGSWTSTEYFVDQITKAEARPGNVWVLSSRDRGQLVHYTVKTADPTWQAVPAEWAAEDGGESFLEDEYLLTDGCLALLDRDRLLIMSGTQDGPVRELQLPQNEDILQRVSYYLSRYRDGILTVAFRDAEGIGLLHADAGSLRYRTVRWQDADRRIITFHSPDEGSAFYAFCCRDERGDGQTAGEEETAQQLSVCVLDDDMQITREIPVGTFTGLQNAETIMGDTGDVMYIYLPEKGQTYCADLKKGKTSLCPEELTDALGKCYDAAKEDGEDMYKKVCVSRNHRFLAVESTPGALAILQTDSGKASMITVKIPDIMSMTFTPDGRQLLTLDSGGSLCRFRTDDGTLLGQAAVYYSGNMDKTDDYKWQFPDKEFFAVTIDKYTNFVSMKDWGVFAYVPSCYGYMEETETLPGYSYTSQGRSYGTFRRHTTAELQEYARQLLNGWELSPTQKMNYGLEQ